MDNNNFSTNSQQNNKSEDYTSGIDFSNNSKYDSPNKKRKKRRQGKMSKKKKRALIIVCSVCGVILALLIAAIWYVASIFGSMTHDQIPQENSEVGITEQSDIPKLDDSKSITNIALFGVDKRSENANGLSDAIMILSIDKLHNKIKVSSLMRDTYVAVEGHGKTKLGHAHSYGGALLAIKTINQNYGLDIRDYATVNFAQMAEIIDAVGGVEIEITEAERLDANHNMIEQAEFAGVEVQTIKNPGKQILSGIQAVGYARIRNVGNSDFGRTDRQRLVMEQLFTKALAMPITAYPEFARKIMPITTTSLDFYDIIGLSSIMLRSDVKFEQARIPNNKDLVNGGQLTVNGTSFLNVDLKNASKRLKAFIYEDIPADEWYEGYVAPTSSHESAA